MANRIQLRRDTSANWTATNPILTQGEIGLELNTGRLKIGNGTSAWSSLPYFSLSYGDISGAPTAVSDLDNDLGFITAADVPAPFSGDYADLTNTPTIPTDVNQLTDTSNLLGGGTSTDYTNFASDIIPDADATRSLGSPTRQWKEIFVSTGSIYIGNVKLSNQNGTLQINTIEKQIDPETEEEIEVILETESVQFTKTTHLELTNDPFIWTPYAGQEISFTKEDYATGAAATDEIDTGLALKRLDNQGLFNPYLEPDWDNTTSDSPSPAGTLWNKDGWTDLTNLNQRTYYSFYDTFLRFGNNVLTAEAVMKDVANNKYYKFDFTVWGNANIGAPVTYTRTELDPVTGAELSAPVQFVKAGYADPTVVNDPIGPGLTIARANQQSIYNIALETSYNTQGDPEDSPEGTVWNGDGWDDFKDVRNRSYGTFQETLNYAIGENIIDKELVMHDTINNKYWAFKFSSWTQSGNGGGFSYTRQLINTSNLFVKPDNDTNTVDIFVEDDGNGAGIGITRDYNNGIYNPYREGSWNDTLSPGGTLWNTEGWDDLSDITTRTYQPFYAAFGNGGLGNKVPGTKTVMYIPEADKYYAIHWLSWTQSGGGGFSYLRYELDTTKVSEGIRFADGTMLKSAAGVGRVKSTASGGRRIEEVVGSNTVSVTSITTTNLTTVTSRASTNQYEIWFDVTATTIDDIMDNPQNYGNAYDLQFSLDNTNWYNLNGWGQTGIERAVGVFPNSVSYNQGDTVYFRYKTGGQPVVWWDKADLPGGSANFRGAVIDYHAYTGEATWIGTIHIVSDSGEEHISHTEVGSGTTDSENDDLWLVQNEGTISYRRIDGESKTAKFHWTAKVFYGSEFYD